MKRNIYFIGFAGAELSSLESALAALSALWEVTWPENTTKADHVLAAAPPDAIVINMAPQDHAGAQWLHDTAARWPKAVLFIIGEISDQSLIVNCIGGTHQFISRPVKGTELTAIVQRGLALDAWLSSDALQALAPRLRRLPSLPATYFELLKQIESPAFSTQSIGEVIARDPVVTARLLQLVNSSAFALAQKVTDPADAVSLLGIETIKAMVLCLQVFSPSDETRRSGVDPEQLWTHSFQVANVARQITASETGSPRLANDAFTAGLLHDVGRIVLAANLPQEYNRAMAAAQAQGLALTETEAAEFGVNHAQVGAYLMGRWGMPAALVEATAAHHAPSQTRAQEFSVLTAVHVANVIVHAGDAPAPGRVRPQFDAAYLETIGLADRPAAWQRLHTPPAESTPKPAPAPAGSSASEIPAPPWNWFTRAVLPAAAVILVLGAIWFWWPHSEQKVQARMANSPVTITNQLRSHSTPAPAPVEVLQVATTEPNANVPTAKTAIEAGAPLAANPTKTAPEAPPPTATNVPPANRLDAIKVQGVFFRTAQPLALINGKTLQVGDRVNGVEILAIQPGQVTLAWAGEQRVYKIK